jgi:hypothetical protein
LKGRRHHGNNNDNDDDSDSGSYKGFISKKEFEFVLNEEIKKVEEATAVQKKFKRDDSDYTEDELGVEEEEVIIILNHRSVPLTVIITPSVDHIALVENQPAVKRYRNILSKSMNNYVFVFVFLFSFFCV